MAWGTRVPSTCGLVACVSSVPAQTTYLDRVTANTVFCGSEPLIRVFCGFTVISDFRDLGLSDLGLFR